MHVVIAGASGVVGSRVLQRLLQEEAITQVTAVGRRPLEVSHPRLTSRVAELQQAASIAAVLEAPVEVAISCLGTTMKQAGSKAAFRAVDHDAVLALGRAALERGARRFVLVSSLGADPGSRSFYLQTKGEAEAGLVALGYEHVTALRPSLIDDEGGRAERRLGERVGLAASRVLFAAVGRTHRYAPISADTIAAALLRLTLDAPTLPFRAVESDALHALARR